MFLIYTSSCVVCFLLISHFPIPYNPRGSTRRTLRHISSIIDELETNASFLGLVFEEVSADDTEAALELN